MRLWQQRAQIPSDCSVHGSVNKIAFFFFFVFMNEEPSRSQGSEQSP